MTLFRKVFVFVVAVALSGCARSPSDETARAAISKVAAERVRDTVQENYDLSAMFFGPKSKIRVEVAEKSIVMERGRYQKEQKAWPIKTTASALIFWDTKGEKDKKPKRVKVDVDCSLKKDERYGGWAAEIVDINWKEEK